MHNHNMLRSIMITILVMIMVMWFVVFGPIGLLIASALVFVMLCIISACLLIRILYRKYISQYGKWKNNPQQKSHPYSYQYTDSFADEKKQLTDAGARQIILHHSEQNKDQYSVYSAFYFSAGMNEKRTAILLHGYGGCALQMLTYARYYKNVLGMNVLLVDLPAHGESSGNICDLGWKSKEFCTEWVRWVIEKNGEDSFVLLHGYSMGAVEVLRVSGTDLPKQVRLIISDGAYGTANGFIKCYLQNVLHLPATLFLPLIRLMSRIVVGFHLDDVSVYHSTQQSSVPMIVIQGQNDPFTPENESKAIEKIISSKSEMFILSPTSRSGSINHIDPTLTKAIEDKLKAIA